MIDEERLYQAYYKRDRHWAGGKGAKELPLCRKKISNHG